jgi:preprotein translocase subunit SecG
MGGMGWGVIGGKSTSSLGRWGNEEYIARITTGVAVGFLALSLLVAIVSMK